MVFSPVLILILHRVIPFERTWLFLILPSALCFGFILQNVFGLIKSKLIIENFAKHKVVIFAIILSVLIFSLARFPNKHEHFCRTDFKLDVLRKKYFYDVQGQIKTIAATNKSTEFYSAQVMWNFCLKDNPRREIKLKELLNIENQELLIIHLSELARFQVQLNNYELLEILNKEIYIYGKISIFK